MDKEYRQVQELGSRIGYGNLMHTASREWRDNLQERGLEGGEFAVWPCVSMVTECGCDIPHQCEWCCGSGWLTVKVKKVKDAAQ